MAIVVSDFPTTQSQVKANFRVRLPGKDDHDESWIGKVSRCIAMAIWGFNQAAVGIDNDAVPSTKTSDVGMDNWGFAVGIPNGAGGYGRLGATTASGGIAPCTGGGATIWPDQSLLFAPDGVTVIKLVGQVGPGPGTGSFVAVTPGTVGNIGVGSQLTWQSPPSGSDPTVTLSTALGGAIDIETTPQEFTRVQTRMQKPPKGGAEADYATWALAANAGVARGYPYPLRGGMSTVHMVITVPGSGQARIPSGTVQTNVTNYITGTPSSQGQRPVTVDGYRTLVPYMPNANALAIKLRMVPFAQKYNFNWASGGTPLLVSSWNPGTLQLTLQAAAPQSLITAIQGGNQPSIQIFTSGQVIPTQVKITAIDNTNTILTLAVAPPVPPVNGDNVYPGGPMVSAITGAILNYINGLGPSRASGYADPTDPWEDTCAVARLEQIALSQTDTDGITRFASNVVTPATINGASQDRQATDTLSGIELLYAGSIVVCD